MERIMRIRLPENLVNEKGASAVEFAIVLPLLLLVIFGIIEWGLYMYDKQTLTHAAREGARYGVHLREGPRNQGQENQEIKDIVLEYAEKKLVTFGTDDLTGDDIDIFRPSSPPPDRVLSSGIDPDDDLSYGSDLLVTLTYDYEFLFMKLKPPIGPDLGTLTISAESTMKME